MGFWRLMGSGFMELKALYMRVSWLSLEGFSNRFMRAL